VAGERQLVLRREDAHVGVDTVAARTGDERRLGEVELARDRLHLLVADVRRVLEDGQRVARERVVANGEDVDDPIGEVHAPTLPERHPYSGDVTSVPSQPPEPQGHLVLLRHGETEWSKSGQHTGLTDLPLLPEGEEAARRVADLLSGWTFARVLVSPLQRARRTAELAGLTEYEIDPRLKEWDYGGYEGLTTKEIRSRVGYMWTVFENGVVPGDTPGETVESVAARAASVLWDIMPTLQDSNVALVAHGHYLRILATVFLRQEVRMGAKLLLDAGSISILEWEREQPAIRTWNQPSPKG